MLISITTNQTKVSSASRQWLRHKHKLKVRKALYPVFSPFQSPHPSTRGQFIFNPFRHVRQAGHRNTVDAQWYHTVPPLANPCCPYQRCVGGMETARHGLCSLDTRVVLEIRWWSAMYISACQQYTSCYATKLDVYNRLPMDWALASIMILDYNGLPTDWALARILILNINSMCMCLFYLYNFSLRNGNVLPI